MPHSFYVMILLGDAQATLISMSLTTFFLPQEYCNFLHSLKEGRKIKKKYNSCFVGEIYWHNHKM